MGVALLLAGVLAAIAVISSRYQLRNLARLRGSQAMASDDRRYLRGQCRRRLLNSVLLLVLAGGLAGAFLSGGMAELGRIAADNQQNPPNAISDDDKELVRFWAYYWIAFLILLFIVVSIAIADYAATTLYGRQQLRRIQHEQSNLLERDLAMYRQKKLNERMKGLKE